MQQVVAATIDYDARLAAQRLVGAPAAENDTDPCTDCGVTPS
jgi:hypothetical protein